ncbi:MAG: glycosyltransferase [Flavobacterium sp.]|nr:glycosyltransferase [Flavobacterium sp.]
MKKLLVITPSFPKDASESHIIPFLQHVLGVFQKNHSEVELTIIAIHKPVGEPYFFKGMGVIPLNGNDLKYPLKLWFLTKSFFKIWKLQRLNRYDGIFNLWFHEFSVFTPFINKNTFTWLMGQDVKNNNLTLKIFTPKPDKIRALSHFNNEILYKTAGIRAHKIIPMAIDEAIFPELNEGERAIAIFGAGWLSTLKNYKLFLEVILEVKKTIPAIKAEIAGTGDQETALKLFATENNLQDNVVFTGLISHRETLEKMNNSKIFLHPSIYEGGSTVYFEALFSGCQLIGTLPMMDKTLENFHLHESKKAIVEKIIWLLENPIPAKRIRYYSMDFVCQEIYDLFYS